jgi:hypothetical protein
VNTTSPAQREQNTPQKDEWSTLQKDAKKDHAQKGLAARYHLILSS